MKVYFLFFLFSVLILYLTCFMWNGLMKHMKIMTSSLKTVIVRLIYVVLLFSLIHGVDDYKTYAGLLVLSTFLNHSISFIYVKRQVKFDFSDLTIIPHLKPLLLVLIFSNANILYTQLDRLVLGYMLEKKKLHIT